MNGKQALVIVDGSDQGRPELDMPPGSEGRSRVVSQSWRSRMQQSTTQIGFGYGAVDRSAIVPQILGSLTQPAFSRRI